MLGEELSRYKREYGRIKLKLKGATHKLEVRRVWKLIKNVEIWTIQLHFRLFFVRCRKPLDSEIPHNWTSSSNVSRSILLADILYRVSLG